jgi:hypothetical protein
VYGSARDGRAFEVLLTVQTEALVRESKEMTSLKRLH